jgi:hypothetical protein
VTSDDDEAHLLDNPSPIRAAARRLERGRGAPRCTLDPPATQ